MVTAKNRNGSYYPLERKYYELNTRCEVTNVKQPMYGEQETWDLTSFSQPTHRPTTVYSKEENDMVTELKLYHMKYSLKVLENCSCS